MNLSHLLAELKRRRVLRVAGAYLVGGAVAVQLASDLLPALRLPEWTVTFVAALAIIGFPVAVVLAWAFDITPEGVRRATKAGPPPTPLADHVAQTRREARAAMRGIAVFVVAIAIVSGAWYGWRRESVADTELDANALVVLPFRFTADPSLDYLREGMVDLLAVKFTGEGGPRAVDARPTLSAWRRAVSSEDDDLDLPAATRLARSLGAGQLLVGGIIGTPGRFTVTATLHGIDGSVRARAEVEGTADELAGSIDRLVAELLSLRAGEDRQRIATLTSASLPALRAYLAGQAAYRAGNFEQAASHFVEALAADTTFALAALGLQRASGWTGGPHGARAQRLAWQHRDRLPPRDREFMVAWFGEAYPAPYAPAAQIRALEHYVAGFADHADAWYELGDALFHRGGLVGYADALDRSIDAFRRALALDPHFAPARVHLMEGLIIGGDTAALRSEAELYFAQSTDPREHALYAWMVATALGDETAYMAHLVPLDSMATMQLVYLTAMSQRLGLDAASARRALDIIGRRAVHDQDRVLYWSRRIDFDANAGRYTAAREAGASQARATRAPEVALQVPLVHALGYPDADRTAAADAARQLERTVEPLSDDADRRMAQRDSRCMLAQFALDRGDIATAERHRQRLADPAELERDNAMARTTFQACALVIEAGIAITNGAPDAGAHVARLEQLALTERLPAGFREYLSLAIGRLHARLGDYDAALAALRYRDRYTSYGLATSLLLSARLMVETGDTDGAIRAYRHYLALRPDPEPGPPAEEVETAARELAALLIEGGRE